VPTHPAGRLDVQRYWIQFVPWIALAVGGAVHVLVGTALRRSSERRRGLARGAVAFLVVVGPLWALALTVSGSPLLAPNGGTPMAGVSAELQRLGAGKGTTVYTDWQTTRLLPVYQRPPFGGQKRWSATVRSITGSRQPRPGDYALLVATDRSPCAFCTDALRAWRERHPTVPQNWTRVYASADDGYVLYAVR